jgi:hypothetical protein
MRNRFPREELLRVVEASPKAVGTHDRQAWLSIFAEENIVEDPVGSTPHRTWKTKGKAEGMENTPLERFYDTFIAPNEIKFHVEQDIVAGNTVIRDLEIEIVMSEALEVSVPMHLFYELDDEDGKPKICHLSAHWELPGMIKQVMSNGFAGLQTMTKLGIRMVKYQGITGALGFSKGFFGIHQKGKGYVREFVTAANARNPEWLSTLFCSKNTGIEFPEMGATLTPDVFAPSLDMKISVSKIISAGFITTFTFYADNRGRGFPGVGRFEFDSKTKKIRTAQFFRDQGELNLGP